uniref:Uncharacterized protein n=1 Tax=Arundo donax TaxID=35708 RepID=A0A0A9GN32_ARUDO
MENFTTFLKMHGNCGKIRDGMSSLINHLVMSMNPES